MAGLVFSLCLRVTRASGTGFDQLRRQSRTVFSCAPHHAGADKGQNCILDDRTEDPVATKPGEMAIVAA
ncbi:hypothetical protein [Jiella mangrovi]|uniref:Uncharacterized protein n=1 Tax=Jiella mangrovi TaxID=2821407 RepID=A0ABS4BMR3_9HYPH|nr:hypothetical protein [Jiella mangrovi]MBP0618027.1 hypothetical protein [Jiella mangrovi]